MFDKKLVISVIVIFVLAMASGFVVHGTILHGEYAKLPNLMRSEEAASCAWNWLVRDSSMT